MAAPNNLQVSFSPLTLGHGATIPIDGTMLHVSGDASTNSNPIDNPAQVYLRVTVPPTAGSITINGVPGSNFTLAQAQAGHVLYHNNTNTSATSDSFVVWARCNEGLTALPLGPRFVTTATANAPGAEQAGLYFGAMLAGAVDADIFSGHFSSPAKTNDPFTVTTTAPNSVLLVCFVASAGTLGPTVLPAQTVTGISFAGLSFTRLSQQTHPVYQPSFSTGATGNYTLEVWWALAPSPVSGTFTLTTQPLGVTGTVMRTDVTVFSGLANPSAPFDTNASNFQHLISTSPPWTGMVMTPDAPEYRVLPWIYELVVGNVGAVSPVAPMPGTLPKGYGTVNGEADTINNTYTWHSAGRGPASATASIVFTGPVPTPTPTLTAPDENLISLSVSYDRGHSFGSPVSQPMGQPGEYRKSLLWRRLGMGRDAVFKVEWSCARPTALQGAWIEADIGDGGQEKK